MNLHRTYINSCSSYVDIFFYCIIDNDCYLIISIESNCCRRIFTILGIEMHNYNIVYGTCIGTCAPLCFFLYATPSLAQAQFSHRIPYYGRHAFTPSLTTKSSEECEFYLTLAYLTLLFHHDYCSCDDTRVLRIKTRELTEGPGSSHTL